MRKTELYIQINFLYIAPNPNGIHRLTLCILCMQKLSLSSLLDEISVTAARLLWNNFKHDAFTCFSRAGWIGFVTMNIDDMTSVKFQKILVQLLESS